MNFDLTDEQQMLQAAARDFLAARLNSEKIRALGESDDALQRGPLEGDGGPQLARPRGLRGARRPGARHGRARGADGAARLRAGAGPALSRPRSPPSRSRRRPPTSSASATWRRWRSARSAGTLALWDAGAGWTPDDITLEPERSNGGYVLNGEKLFVLDAATRRLPDRRCDRRPALHRRARRRRRHDRRRRPTIDGTRKQYAVKLDGVEVGEDALFERRRRRSSRARDRGYIALAAELTGDRAARARDGGRSTPQERKQFGRPIGSYQAVSHTCAQMLLETEGARSAVYYAAWAADNEPETAPLAASMAKAYASDAACSVTGSSLQVHGGIGFTWEHDLHLWLKRARCSRLSRRRALAPGARRKHRLRRERPRPRRPPSGSWQRRSSLRRFVGIDGQLAADELREAGDALADVGEAALLERGHDLVALEHVHAALRGDDRTRTCAAAPSARGRS